MNRLTVRPTGQLQGEISVPGDKSITHRAILLAAVAEGTTTIRHYLPADDCLRTLSATEALGGVVRRESAPDRVLRITGVGAGPLREPDGLLHLGNSGTSLRLLTGLLAGQPIVSILTGDASLRRRPMRRLIEPLRQMGANIYGWGGGERAPVVVNGRQPLRAIEAKLPVASAQLKSALLLAALFAEGTTTVTEPACSRDHTERILPQFGVTIEGGDGRVSLRGGQRLRAAQIDVPGDLSSAAFLIVAATLVRGGDVRLLTVGVNPTRTGVLDVLKGMGAHIVIHCERDVGGEPVADLVVRHASLNGVTITGERIVTLIDEFPIVCVAAALAQGETIVRDAQELRVKESDRIAVMVTELRKFGVEIEERADGVRIIGGKPLIGTVCQSHGDHRVAMALAVAGLVAQGETIIEEVDCIETSFPGFAEHIRQLGGDIAVTRG